MSSSPPWVTPSCSSSSASPQISPEQRSSRRRTSHTIKIPTGLRDILNDLTREVLNEAPAEVVDAAEIHAFLADYLERRLRQRGEQMGDQNVGQYATDSDSGVETAGPRLSRLGRESEVSGEGDDNHDKLDAALSQLEKASLDEGTAKDDKKKEGKKAQNQDAKSQRLKLEFSLLEEDNRHTSAHKDSFATADLVLTGDGSVRVVSVGNRDANAGLEEEEGSISVPIHLVATPRPEEEEESAILNELLSRVRYSAANQGNVASTTPIHSITSATSDLPPSPASLVSLLAAPNQQSSSSPTRHAERQVSGPNQQPTSSPTRHAERQVSSSVPIRLPLPPPSKSPIASLPMDVLSVSCPDNFPAVKSDLVSQEALLLKVANPPSPPLAPPPIPVSLSTFPTSTKGVQTEEGKGGEIESGRTKEKEVLSVGQQTIAAATDESGTQVLEADLQGGGTCGSSKSVQQGEEEVGEAKKKGGRPVKERGRVAATSLRRGVSVPAKVEDVDGKKKEIEDVASSAKSKKVRIHRRRSSWNNQSDSNNNGKKTLDKLSVADKSAQTEDAWQIAVQADLKVQTEDAARIAVQDDLVARVLLEHAGAAFDPPDPRRATNYLDLSKIGEEGETPASDEIWLAVEDGEEIDRGFLTSSDEEGEVEAENHHRRRLRGGVEVRSLPSTVETDKLSTTANVAGHVVARQQEVEGEVEEEHEDMLEGLDEEAARSEEMYVGVAARLQGVLSEELLPIQDTLAVTERSVVVLADKLQRMEAALQGLADKIGSPKRSSKKSSVSSSSSSETADAKNLADVLDKIERLSSELSSATTAGRLREDNDSLRQDLANFRKREKHLLARIEEMERSLTSSAKNGKSRPSSRRGSSTSDEIVPKVDLPNPPPVAKPRESKVKEIEVGEAIKLLAKDENKTTKNASSCESHSEEQLVRSDNAILRQDLQVFRQRETQLVRRNRELEDRLLARRAAYSKKHNSSIKHQRTTTNIDISKEARDTSSASGTATSNSSVEREALMPNANRDLRLPGIHKDEEAKEEEEKAASGSEPQLNGGDVKDEKDQQDVTTRAKSSRPGGRRSSCRKKQGTVVKSSSESSSQPSDEGEKADEESGSNWRVTVSSNQDLVVASPSPNTVVVKKSAEEAVEKEIEEIENVKSPTPPPVVVAKPKAQVVQPKVSLPKKTRPPKIAKKPAVAATTSSSSQEAPEKSKLPDARSDPIPKPTQFPSARPPRDYKPLRKIPAKKDVKNDDDEGSSAVIQMLVKEEPKEVGLADIPLSSQVRESPDGANSSVLDGGVGRGAWSRASNATTAANIDLEEEEEEGEDKKGEEGVGSKVVEDRKTEVNLEEGKRVVDKGSREEVKDSSRENKGVVQKDPVKVSLEKGRRERRSTEEEEVFEDVLMDFVMMDITNSPKRNPPSWLGKRRPVLIRRTKTKKQRSRSLSTEKLSRVSETSSPKKMRRSQHHRGLQRRGRAKANMFRSAERLPTLSPFDEERIVWMRNLEDDIQMEEERRSRCSMRRVMEEEEMKNELSSSSSSSSSSTATSVLYMQQPRNKVARKQWDVGNASKELQIPNGDIKNDQICIEKLPEKPLPKPPAPEQAKSHHRRDNKHKRNAGKSPMNVECFVVSRGWQLDQSRLLRALDSCACANFSRVQITATMSRLVESVRPNLDAVVVHLGSQELMDAAHSIATTSSTPPMATSASVGRSSLAESVAASISTVASRQLLKVAGQNRSTHFIVSLPLPFSSSDNSPTSVGRSYDDLRRAFVASLRANCSAAANVHCADNDAISESKHFTDGGVLSASGVRKLAKLWEEQLCRISKTRDGQLVFRHESCSDSAGSSKSSATN